MKKTKKLVAALLGMVLVVGLVGCNAPGTQEGDSSATTSDDSAATSGEPDLTFSSRDRDPSYDEATATKIDLTGDAIAVSGAGARAEGSTVTISADGTYIVKGSLANGQILVDLPGDEDKAQIVLDGASVHNETGPALYVRQADKVFVTLAEGSVNELTDGAEYVATDDGNDPKAALYSKDDLVINGSGALNVTGSYYHGIASTNDLKVTGGSITVSSVQDAFHGKDCIKIGGGSIVVNAGDDAFHSEYLFYLEDGTVNVESCVEGYEAEKVYVYGGDSTIAASDDGVNASAAEDEDAAADDAANADYPGAFDGAEPPAMPDNGEMPQMPEGMEPPEGADGFSMERPGRGEGMHGGADGDMPDMPDDATMRRGGPDGVDGNDAPGEGGGRFDERTLDATDGEQAQNGRGMMRGGMGGGGMGALSGASEDCLIRINGGTLRVDAGGDGLDSNGFVEVNGGTVLVSGSTTSADSGLDYEFGAAVNGGDVIIVGAAGMAEDFTGGTQTHLMERASGSAGSTVEVKDASGNVLVSYTAPKAFQTVVASAPNCATIAVR